MPQTSFSSTRLAWPIAYHFSFALQGGNLNCEHCYKLNEVTKHESIGSVFYQMYFYCHVSVTIENEVGATCGAGSPFSPC